MIGLVIILIRNNDNTTCLKVGRVGEVHGPLLGRGRAVPGLASRISDGIYIYIYIYIYTIIIIIIIIIIYIYIYTYYDIISIIVIMLLFCYYYYYH